MITGAHGIIYSRKPEQDRVFFRDVLQLPSVDVGEGWLIFALPPSELAVHPSRRNSIHTLYFICADIREFTASMSARGVACTPVQHLSWGDLTEVSLPGGGKLGVYQAHHARPRVAARKQKGRK